MKFSYSLIKKIFPKAPPKKKLAEMLNMHSFETEDLSGDVLEIGLPPNRYSDSASHIGIAREAAAISGAKTKSIVKKIINPPSNKGFIKIDIREPRLCERYTARYFEFRGGIKDSPKWMKDVLVSCGINPINGIVDIMNYVMLETGQPLHVFDADKLAANRKSQIANRVQIIVRRARKGEKLETLDDQKIVLDKDVLVIADKKGPIAIAGIKGGKGSGVGPRTKRIIVEAANFNPVITYKAARRLKLQTDASARFGHGISPELAQWGLDRATELILKQKTWLLDSVDYYPKPAGDGIIEFSPAKYEAVIGAPIDIKKAQKYFELFGLTIEEPRSSVISHKLSVRVPPWRTDISGAEDLAEEIVRLEGYGKLKPKAPVLSVKPAFEEDAASIKDRVRNILVGLRLDEVYNSSFVGDADISRQYADSSRSSPRLSARSPQLSALVEVGNPIAEDKKFLRPSLVPLLVKNVEDNSRFFEKISIFELGKVFSKSGKGSSRTVQERMSLGVALAARGDDKLILEVKGLAEEILAGLGVSDFSTVHTRDSKDTDAGANFGDLLRIEADHRIVAELGHMKLGKDLNIAFGEFDLDKILPLTEEAKEFIPLKRFPSVLRDISVLVPRDTRIGDAIQEIQEANKELIENVDLVDEYVNEKLGGKQSLTFRIIFQSDERTLIDGEVNAEMDKIAAALKNKFKAEIR